MNWSCPVWLDWFHGGLQFQIEHHLFPRMPRHNLRAAARHVRAACQQLGLEYHCPTFWQVQHVSDACCPKLQHSAVLAFAKQLVRCICPPEQI